MNQSIGLGDTVEKITKATGIKKLVDIMAGDKDCGCDKRKEFLNQLWHYKLKPKCLTDEEINEYHDFILTRKVYLQGNGKAIGKLSEKETKFLCDFFGLVFNRKVEYPKCHSCAGTAYRMIDIIYKLDTVFVNNVPNKIKEQEPIKKAMNVNTNNKQRNGRKPAKKRNTKKKTTKK